MATKHRKIFTLHKPLVDIYSGLDHEGKQVEVREDAEQLVKWHEIADALVAAGYYRAQLQGLSAFDKIVGGLTWCIELCDIDVDVNLMFEENLTIGKKIALTEKIVKVLPSIKCPHIIEPHQIQGLDFINIYPLVQWLIKYSSEFREVKEDELRKFAVLQFEKDHMFESDRAGHLQKEKILRNLTAVQNLYKPCRVRKRKTALPGNELEQVNAILSEYDQRMLLHVTNDKDSQKDEGLEYLLDMEKTLADPTSITTEADIFHDLHENSSDTKIHYAVLQSEITGEVSKELEESEKLKYSEEVERLAKTMQELESEVSLSRQDHQRRLEEAKKQYSSVITKLQLLTNRLLSSEGNSKKDVKSFYSSLKDLATERNELMQLIKHREHQNEKLENELRLLQDPDRKVVEEPLNETELKEFQEREAKLKTFISELKVELGRLNREVLRYTIAIDEVPGPAELLQYEKRFIELYNQVAAKHKETKQFYVFYNTLYEVKLYTSKELSLLNSILDNYEEAMSSSKKREEFMTQFESIVDWVNQTVKKVETKYQLEKDKKTALHNEYSRLMEVERQCAAALKKLAEQRQKITKNS